MKLFEMSTHRHIKTLKMLKSKPFRYFVLFFIFGSIACLVFSSFKLNDTQYTLLFLFLCLSTSIFTIEYIVRVISAPALHPTYSNFKARLKYIISFYGVVDIIAIAPVVLLYLHWETSQVHLIMLPYIFIIFKLIRYSTSFRLIGQVLYQAKDELTTAYTACGILVCFSAIIMYYIERGAQPEAFDNIGNGLWWAVVSFTTVGYGDIYPITPLGKTLSSIISLIGIGMIALPTGIISSSFMRVVQQKKDADAARKEANEARKEAEIAAAKKEASAAKKMASATKKVTSKTKKGATATKKVNKNK